MKKPKRYSPSKSGSKKSFTLNERKTGRHKGYDDDWRSYRFRFLHHNPRCYICNAKATVVDHIRAHKGDQDLFENTHNHLPECESCHNFLTGRFDRHNEPKTEEKCQWILERRKQLNVTTRIKVVNPYRK